MDRNKCSSCYAENGCNGELKKHCLNAILEHMVEPNTFASEKRVEAIRILANAILWLDDKPHEAMGSNDYGAVAWALEAVDRAFAGF